MSSLTISSSLRFFITKIPFSQKPTKTNLSFFYRPITFQKVPTTKPIQSSPSSSMQLQPIDELPPKLQEIINLFQSVQNPKAKYEQLMFYGKNLKTLETQFKTSENKVEGCVSQVWVRAYLDLDNRNVFFEADSDSVLTKGLAALLVNGLSGRPVEEVLRVSPDFVVLLGLQQSLTPSRNNGFLNMLKLMQKKALELVVEAEKGSNPGSKKIDGDDKSLSLGSNDEVGSGENSIGSENLGSKIDGDDKSLSLGLNNEVGSGENLIGRGKSGSKIDGGDGKLNVGLSNEMGGEGENGSSSGDLGSRGMRIREILERELSPIELEVEDISYQHAGHAGVRGSDGETHFNVKVVSKEFEGKSLVKRHRLIYNLLQEELQSGLHALSIVAKAPAEVGGR